ncbi:hypothetical protein O7634_02275 [Micromonospora sp. WMMD1120]|uniref:hypothetical protein n=1 Tax=Micromonospora sp. WMMD1120 TaxID=3016106 RepID=UPI00241706F8|nr:hypothetical protein [Micromonospora sp. WMMD1120]MDG4805584.1 hypothetical protein [Micromonospora sp. WMMD1120]
MSAVSQPSTLIDAVVRLMRDLAIHPLALEIDQAGARVLAAMPAHALRRRSRGPYTENNLPPEATALIDWLGLRLSVRREPADVTIEGGGQWPRLLVELPVTRLTVRYVVPEDAPPGYQPEPNNVTLSGDVNIALEFLATSLRALGGRLRGEPPITVTLTYPDDPNYERNVADVPEDFRRLIPPVVADLAVDRRRFSAKQRAAHDEALRAAAYDDQPLEQAGGWLTTRLGSARLRLSS